VTRTGACLVVAVAISCGGVAAAADESSPAQEAAEPAAEPERAPGSTTLGAPAETPAPVLAPARPEPAPLAQEPAVTKDLASDPRFGDPGQIALNGALSASIGHLGYDATDNTSTTINVEPAFDYFSSRNFSEGVTAFFRYGNSQFAGDRATTTTTIGATARIGRNIWLGGAASFWPKLAVGVWRTWYHYTVPTFGGTVTTTANIDGLSVQIGPSSKLTENALFAEIQAPFLFHLARHFYVGFGPDAYIDLIHSVDSAKNLRRFVGASSTLGGWF